ncbi:MAG TPA: ATP-binding protein [Pseudomonadota bacterium]|nr:ATP-binding protein [Pseudomonadota bacterium]
MLKSVRFINWKSFRDATLHLDPLTVLIGANASGKSNAIEGLELLARLARGTDIQTALDGGEKLPSIRGGVEWAGFRGADAVTIDVLFQEPEKQEDRLYRTSIQLKPTLELSQVLAPLRPDGTPIIDAERQAKLEEYFASLFQRDEPRRSRPNESSHMSSFFRGLISEMGFERLMQSPFRRSLRSLFVLMPETALMRRYVPLAESLLPDSSNLAGVIAALPDSQRKEIEDLLTEYLAKLPEYQVKRIYVERFGLHKSDAMLCCEEPWGTAIDARCMSDGTLRFVAILTALLTLPSGSLLVIEDVDTGIHPSRLELVFQVLRSEGKRRGVDVLVTTHNEAFLDALPPEMWPFVTVAHRDSDSGESRLTPLDELGEYGRIVAAGPLGRAVKSGVVERAAHKAALRPAESK